MSDKCFKFFICSYEYSFIDFMASFAFAAQMRRVNPNPYSFKYNFSNRNSCSSAMIPYGVY